MSNTAELENKAEVQNCNNEEQQDKLLCNYVKEREASPLYTYNTHARQQKSLECSTTNNNSNNNENSLLTVIDKVLPSQMQSIQMLESANVTSVERQHHHRHFHVNDKSDLEEVWFSNIQQYANAEESKQLPLNENEHKELIAYIGTLANNVHWLKEELRETQRQLLQSWGSYIAQQEEMRLLQTRISDLERQMQEHKDLLETKNRFSSQTRRRKDTKKVCGEECTYNSTPQESTNKTKQQHAMRQVRCTSNNTRNKNNCSCFVTKLRNGVSGFDVYGSSFINKRSLANKKSFDHSINNYNCGNQYSKNASGRISAKRICEQIRNSNSSRKLNDVMRSIDHAIAKRSTNTFPELLLQQKQQPHEDLVHLSQEQPHWQQQQQQQEVVEEYYEREYNPEASNGTTERERSNIQDSSVPSDGSNTVWVSSIRRVSSAYIEHNNLSSFTNGFFVACDESVANGEVRQVIDQHVNDRNPSTNNTQTLENEEKIWSECYESGSKGTSPFLIAVDSHDGNSTSLHRQESERNAENICNKFQGEHLQEIVDNKTTHTDAKMKEGGRTKAKPLSNVTNLLPKCNSCLNTKVEKAHEKCNNTFQCERYNDYKNNNNYKISKNNNNNNYSKDCMYHYKGEDSNTLHATLPLLHHTHSVMLDTTHN